MLKLKGIKKVYRAGDDKVVALRDVNLAFRKNEFVSILGPSGCGKTTLLNIIGGLDHYTAGDLVINGKSTRTYKDRDWDTYRNHSIGFVFQSYNLISHQTVLANVELALTISGVAPAERRRRATDALVRVGLGDQLHKRPNQMSGGQMQRVAIARALVNDPEILLADEPTGALDSTTSVQIMNLLREIASDRLVIMVTHNPDLAAEYSTRIISLLDGRVVKDTNPYTAVEKRQRDRHTRVLAESKRKIDRANKGKKTSMSFKTALGLSFKNLLTKKARTFLTSFAGSIGIIGIALIQSVSTGVNNYIAAVQRDTLSSYPIQIQSENADYSGLISNLMDMNAADGKVDHDLDKVYSNSVLYDLLNSVNSIEIEKNNLADFKVFLDSDQEIAEYVSAIRYRYGEKMTIYTKDTDGKVVRADLAALLGESGMGGMGAFAASFASLGIIEEMLPDKASGGLINETLLKQYDLVHGAWPTSKNEIVLIVNKNNEISDVALYALGLKSSEEFKAAMEAYQRGEEVVATQESWSYEEICQHDFRLILDADRYVKNPDGSFTDISETSLGLSKLYDEALTLRVSGIIRASDDAVSSMLKGALGYTSALTDYLIEATRESEIVKAQLANPTVDVISGLPFETEPPTAAEKTEQARAYVASLSDAEKITLLRSLLVLPTESFLSEQVSSTLDGKTRAEMEAILTENPLFQTSGYDPSILKNLSDEQLYAILEGAIREETAKTYTEAAAQRVSAMTDQMILMTAGMLTDEQYTMVYETFMPSQYSDKTLGEVLQALGYVDNSTPISIEIYAKTFEDKDKIAECITRYNSGVAEEDQISYTDYVALLMSSVSIIINAISYVLIAFVAISLVVSSIMIGIITYISVLERTKEIGILRAIGASKRDVSRVFNAETLIVGFAAGALGILVSVLLIVAIINPILYALTELTSLRAALPVDFAILLVLISMFLTLIAGLLPSRIAAKKDPVVALRTE